MLASSSSTFSAPQLIPQPKPKPKRRKSTPDDRLVDDQLPTNIDNPKALLNLMNTNIKTMRRVRHTHGKFAALNATTLVNEEAEDGAAVAGPSSAGDGTGVLGGMGSGVGSGADIGERGGGEALNAAADDEILNEKVDERPWVMMQRVPTRMSVKGGKGKERQVEEMVRDVRGQGGVDVGEKNARGCMQWTNQKILEHVGFQGPYYPFLHEHCVSVLTRVSCLQGHRRSRWMLCRVCFLNISAMLGGRLGICAINIRGV
jgi:transcriptional activator SPT7